MFFYILPYHKKKATNSKKKLKETPNPNPKPLSISARYDTPPPSPCPNQPTHPPFPPLIPQELRTHLSHLPLPQTTLPTLPNPPQPPPLEHPHSSLYPNVQEAKDVINSATPFPPQKLSPCKESFFLWSRTHCHFVTVFSNYPKIPDPQKNPCTHFPPLRSAVICVKQTTKKQQKKKNTRIQQNKPRKKKSQKECRFCHGALSKPPHLLSLAEHKKKNDDDKPTATTTIKKRIIQISEKKYASHKKNPRSFPSPNISPNLKQRTITLSPTSPQTPTHSPPPPPCPSLSTMLLGPVLLFDLQRCQKKKKKEKQKRFDGELLLL